MSVNKLLVAGGIAVAGLGSLGAVHLASAQSATPTQATPPAQVQVKQDTNVTTKDSESATEINDQTESKSAKDTDNVNNQQGPQGVDSNNGTEAEGGLSGN